MFSLNTAVGNTHLLHESFYFCCRARLCCGKTSSWQVAFSVTRSSSSIVCTSRSIYSQLQKKKKSSIKKKKKGRENCTILHTAFVWQALPAKGSLGRPETKTSPHNKCHKEESSVLKLISGVIFVHMSLCCFAEVPEENKSDARTLSGESVLDGCLDEWDLKSHPSACCLGVFRACR